MLTIHNTKTTVILVITDELYKLISDLQINLDEYFKQVINFPAIKLLDCLDERINGKIIKSDEQENYDITINIGDDNKILSSISPSDINITTLIGTKGRMRFMSNGAIFSTICIIVVETNKPIIFKCENEYFDFITNKNDTVITYLTEEYLKVIVELAIDNDSLSNNIVSDDNLGKLLVKYLINNPIINMFNLSFFNSSNDIIISQFKQLILNVNQSNITLLNQKITNGKSKIMQYYNTDTQPTISRYSSIPY